jgi:YVTN family beta-propeller protein
MEVRLRARYGRKALAAALVTAVAGIAVGLAAAVAGPSDVAGPSGDGTAVTPIGWRVTPAGKQILLQDGSTYADRPYAIAESPDGKTLAISNDGQSTQSLMIVDAATGAIKQTVPYRRPEALFIGLAYAPDGSKLYASGGGSNKIRVFDVAADGRVTEGTPIALPAGVTRPFGDKGPFPAGLAVSQDGSKLYVANNIDNTMSIVSTATRTVLSSTPVGTNPYTVVLSKDGKTAYVSNWGGEQTFTPPSASAPVGTVTQSSAGSVSVLDALTGAPKGTIQVGTHPSALAVDPASGALYVANTDSDNISVIDTATNAVTHTIDLAPYTGAPVGTNPNALAFTSDGKSLFVANAGNNDVDVVDTAKKQVVGSIPTAWYPTGVALAKSGGSLFVINGKGLGAGPNPNGPTPYHGSAPDQYTGSMLKGTLSIVDLPAKLDRDQLEHWTEQVRANAPDSSSAHDGQEQLAKAGDHNHGDSRQDGQDTGFPSTITHVIYVVKENRTYDQLFGDLKGNGDPSLTLFKDESAPNQRALHDRFVTLDNVYAASEVSADGWSWSTAANANTYDQKTWPSDYSGRNRGYDYEGGNFAISPGRDPQNSFIWDRILRAGISLRNYGFWVTGRVPAAVLPTEPELAPVTDPQFPGYNTSIKDQVRIDEWLREFRQFETSGNLPAVQLVRFPNDHTVGTRAGSPSPRAMVADNDLALGKLVDAVSHSKFWASTAIFVIEDDAQNGPDHVDGHRMPAQVISPYTQTGKIDSTFYSTVSVLRSIEQIVGIGALTQFDAAATPLTASFSSKPNLKPYDAVVPSAMGEVNGASAPMSAASQRMDFSQQDTAPEEQLNAAIWQSVKGAGSEPPASAKH